MAIGETKKRKKVKAIIPLLMLLASASQSVQTQASPETGFTLWAIVPSGNPYWGAFGGYNDIIAVIEFELAKIGITVKTRTMEKTFWAETIFDNWNVSARETAFGEWEGSNRRGSSVQEDENIVRGDYRGPIKEREYLIRLLFSLHQTRKKEQTRCKGS